VLRIALVEFFGTLSLISSGAPPSQPFPHEGGRLFILVKAAMRDFLVFFDSRYPVQMNEHVFEENPRALIGWRLLGLLYDLWPALALWMLVGALFVLGYTLAGHGASDNIAPFSATQIASWIACWLVTGAYAVLSWRRGGQTLGMRPWRLKVVAADGKAPSWRALCVRYAMATVSLSLGGLGFWWAWVDRDRLTWHDRVSGTRMLRLPKL
jgi:uncharacterized RDD family membrane protein YckC